MMWNSYYDGAGWLWMGGMVLLFAGGLVALAVWAARARSRAR